MTTEAQKRFFDELKTGNVAVLRAMLLEHPEYLDLSITWGDHAGSILNYAAYMGHKNLIRLLVQEIGMNVDAQDGASSRWTPLHHAACESLEAVKLLLELGANTGLKNASGQTPLDVSTGKCREVLAGAVTRTRPRPDQRFSSEEAKQPVWALSSPGEVVCNRMTPDGVYRLTDVFNFETRRMTALALELKDKALAQTVVFFDDIPDKKVLADAHAQLTRLGGRADPSLIWRGRLPGKNRLPGKH